jgi:hypothetical protein
MRGSLGEVKSSALKRRLTSENVITANSYCSEVRIITGTGATGKLRFEADETT